jgi:hypothetical protein
MWLHGHVATRNMEHDCTEHGYTEYGYMEHGYMEHGNRRWSPLYSEHRIIPLYISKLGCRNKALKGRIELYSAFRQPHLAFAK